MSQENPGGELTCPKCGAELASGTEFCGECGVAITAEAGDKRGRRRSRGKVGSLAQQEHKKHIKGARVAIIAVAILTMLGSGLLWNMLSKAEKELDANIAKAERDPSLVVDKAVVAESREQLSTAKLIVFANVGLGCVFFGLWGWAKQNPYAATLTCLILYLTAQGINGIIDPTSLFQGIIIKVIIIFALVQGVKSGLADHKLQQAG